MVSKLPIGVPVLYDAKAATTLAQARFGQDLRVLKPDARDLLFILIQQGYNPYTDLAIYEGKPHITIDGWWNAVKRCGRRIARVPTRPLNSEERVQYGLTPDELGFLSEVWLEGDQHPYAVGFGKASTKNPHRNSPIERSNPARMAMKRASAHALRQTLQGIGFMPPSVGSADAEGVIIDAEVRVIEDGEDEEVTDIKDNPKQRPKGTLADPDDPSDRDWENLYDLKIKTSTEFFRAAQVHFDLQPAQALAAIGLRHTTDMINPQEHWEALVRAFDPAFWTEEVA